MAARPFAALAVIVVLLFLVIGLLAYYRGLWVFGPYAAAAAVSRGTKARAKDESSGDDETERLIAAINHESGARDEKAGAPRD